MGSKKLWKVKFMQIGLIIKKTRLEKKITQEELAESLGVSAQAVSRWETGISYPDITLIPVIANYLNVTADELLGIKLEERKKTIENIIVQNDELINKRYLDDSLKLIQEALKKYPNDERLLDALTKCYWNRMMMTLDKPEMFNYRQELKKLIIDNANKTLEIAKSSDIIEQANLYLIYTYPRMGEEGRLKALDIVNKLPSINYSRELRLRNVLKGTDRKRRIQENILLGVRIINESSSYNLCDCYQDIDDKIRLFKKNIDLIKLIVEGNLYWYNLPCSNYAFRVAELYAKKKDKENTLKYLNESANYAESVCDSPTEGKYDTFYLDEVDFTINKFINYEGNYKLFEDNIFDFIRDFKRICWCKR